MNVVLSFRNGGAESPCRWCSGNGIYKIQEKKIKKDINDNFKKFYVKVEYGESACGRKIPLKIIWSGGRVFKTDIVKNIYEGKPLPDGRIGSEYVLAVEGKECHLFLEGDKWYVIRRQEQTVSA